MHQQILGMDIFLSVINDLMAVNWKRTWKHSWCRRKVFILEYYRKRRIDGLLSKHIPFSTFSIIIPIYLSIDFSVFVIYFFEMCLRTSSVFILYFPNIIMASIKTRKKFHLRINSNIKLRSAFDGIIQISKRKNARDVLHAREACFRPYKAFPNLRTIFLLSPAGAFIYISSDNSRFKNALLTSSWIR